MEIGPGGRRQGGEPDARWEAIERVYKLIDKAIDALAGGG